MHRRNFIASLGALGISCTGLAQAQSGPARLVVGFQAGGIADVIARVVASAGAPERTTVVENLPGAGGRLAANRVKSSRPDGNVALLTLNSAMTIYPYVYQNLSYDPEADFTPVGSIGTSAFLLTVSTALVPDNVQTLADLKTFYRSHPDLAFFGTGGAGSVMHFAGMNVSRRLGLDLVHVPYKGGTPLLQDMLGGQLSTGVTVLGETAPHHASGKLRPIAVMSAQRSRFAPDTPTFAELGEPELVADEGFGIFLPRGASQQSVNDWYAKIQKAVSSPEARAAFESAGFEAAAQDGKHYARAIEAERQKWGPLVISSGFTIDN